MNAEEQRNVPADDAEHSFLFLRVQGNRLLFIIWAGNGPVISTDSGPVPLSQTLTICQTTGG